jgi:hypothetical protein
MHTPHLTVEYSRRLWQEKYLHGIQESEPLISRFGLRARTSLDELRSFVEQCFIRIFNQEISYEEAQVYIHIIRQYTNYNFTKTTTMQGNIRLLVTLTEELLWLWEQVKEIKRDTILITKEERRKLDKIIAKTITEQASSFLNDRTFA